MNSKQNSFRRITEAFCVVLHCLSNLHCRCGYSFPKICTNVTDIVAEIGIGETISISELVSGIHFHRKLSLVKAMNMLLPFPPLPVMGCKVGQTKLFCLRFSKTIKTLNSRNKKKMKKKNAKTKSKPQVYHLLH